MDSVGNDDLSDDVRHWLRQTFSLTDKQIELVAALRQNMTLMQFAASRGVALESVRTRLRRIYRKLGVRSRVELLRELERAEGGANAQPHDEAPTMGVDGLVQRHGLTRREADVASWLAAGLGTADIALALGIGVATVRCHLKAIYSKTWTRSQAELVNRIRAAAATH